MSDLILRTAAHFLSPLLLIFSVFLAVQGHNAPGGGFAGGLVAAAGAGLHALTHDAPSARRLIRVDPRRLCHLGLLVAVLSGLPALAFGEPYLAARWLVLDLGAAGDLALGTPLLFDAGVYLIVVGSALTVVFALQEEDP